MVTNYADSGRVLDGLIEALTTTPGEFAASTTAAFKLIPFRNHAISKDGMTELMTRQNDFLHHTAAISVVNGGYCDQRFEEDGMTLVEMAMQKRGRMGHFCSKRLNLEELASATFCAPHICVRKQKRG